MSEKSMDTVYINYLGKSVEYNLKNHTFSFFCEGRGSFLQRGCLKEIRTDDKKADLSAYGSVFPKVSNIESGRRMIVEYSGGSDCLREFALEFTIGRQGVELRVSAPGTGRFCFEGYLYWGLDMENSTFPVCLNRQRKDLRTASGPAASKLDNALFDRLTDSVLEIGTPGGVRLKYNWKSKCYEFHLKSEGGKDQACIFKIYKNYYAERFGIPYRCIEKSSLFPTPPAGWMTWYAVKFNASEHTVLENARWLSQNLSKYGANCIWVDWEWYHSNLEGTEAEGVDTFNPDKRKYPHGLKHISDKIKEMGLIPALWIGPTNDTNKNSLLAENPQWLLVHEPRWCGRWWVDPSHPGVVNQYIPAIFRQILDWGYEAIKWDCIPVSLEILDRYHLLLFNREKTSEQLMRDIIQSARNVTGQDMYLLSCSGNYFRDITFAMDLFNGARIGGDIFSWKDFIDEGIGRLARYYCYHNIVLYADMDNVVIREEFNTMEQARSRVSAVALTGLPFTMGDNLPELLPERVELLKRALPVIDIHPMDITDTPLEQDIYMINLAICREFESWNVTGIMNTTGEYRELTLDLDCDLHLDADNNEKYLVYDYWRKTLLGIFDKSIKLDFKPFESRVLAIRQLKEHPQILSTSRHITQGGYDLLEVFWDHDNSVLKGKSLIVCGEAYELLLHAPEGYTPASVCLDSDANAVISNVKNSLWKVSLHSGKSGEVSWAIYFDNIDAGTVPLLEPVGIAQ